MENKTFLKELIDEDIYLIKEPVGNVNPMTTTEPEKNLDQASLTEELTTSVEESRLNEPDVEYKAVSLNFKGGNEKNIGIIVNDQNVEFIDEAQEKLLIKILSAINCSLKDVAIINTAKNDNLSVESIMNLPCSIGIIFDSTTDLIDSDKYKVVEINGGKFFKSSSLSHITVNISEKKLLWETLQQVFK